MAHGLSQYIIDRVYFLGVFQQRQNDDNAADISKPVVVWNQYSRRRIVDTTTAMRNYYEVLTNRRKNEQPGRSSSYSTVFTLEGCRWMIHTPVATKDDNGVDDKNDRLLTTFVVVTNPMYPLPLAAACLRDLLRLFVWEQQQRNKVDGVLRCIIGREGTTTSSRPHRLSGWIATMTSCRTNHGARLRQQQSRLDDLFFTYARMSTTTKTASTIGYNGEAYLRRTASSNEQTRSTGMAVALV
jgi:hypothetical protein